MSPCKYLLPVFFVFDLSSKLRVRHIKKGLENSFSKKMAPTIFIKFCWFTVHPNLYNMTLSAIPGKIPETKKTVFIFLSVAKILPLLKVMIVRITGASQHAPLTTQVTIIVWNSVLFVSINQYCATNKVVYQLSLLCFVSVRACQLSIYLTLFTAT